eukprot:3555143-Alexandrium_andersonii.AAC.1
MSASLVGSEMCIRDRRWRAYPLAQRLPRRGPLSATWISPSASTRIRTGFCLLYTSDAADDM